MWVELRTAYRRVLIGQAQILEKRRDPLKLGIVKATLRKSLLLIDDTYNANPASVRAMLAVLARTEPAPGGRRLLAMGDMRELGEHADDLHAGLADAVAASGAAQVFLCGPHMQALWQRLATAQKGVHRPDSTALAGEVAAALRAGDVIAVKGSLGSKMKNVVDAVLAASGGEVGL